MPSKLIRLLSSKKNFIYTSLNFHLVYDHPWTQNGGGGAGVRLEILPHFENLPAHKIHFHICLTYQTNRSLAFRWTKTYAHDCIMRRRSFIPASFVTSWWAFEHISYDFWLSLYLFCSYLTQRARQKICEIKWMNFVKLHFWQF